MQYFNSYVIRHPGDRSPAFCPKCKQDKSPSEYYVHSVRSDGAIRHRPYCKECRRVRVRQQKSRPVHANLIISGVQTCKICNVEKPLHGFYANGCFDDGSKKYRSRCKTCVLEKSKTTSSAEYKVKAARRSASPKNFISSVLNHAAKRKQHLGFNIDLVYLVDLFERQNGDCALTGAKMTYVAGHGRVPTNISIDRIDSSKGYVRGNVQFVCDVTNRMKQDLDQGDFVGWCKLVLEKSNG